MTLISSSYFPVILPFPILPRFLHPTFTNFADSRIYVRFCSFSVLIHQIASKSTSHLVFCLYRSSLFFIFIFLLAKMLAQRSIQAIISSSRKLTSNEFLRRSYHDIIIDHYENPRNVGSLDKNKPNVGTGTDLADSYIFLNNF
jgi:hypothetical protein